MNTKYTVVFTKSGKEIKQAVSGRIEQLRGRLEKRNLDLEEFMKDTQKLRSFLIRSSVHEFRGHGTHASTLYSQDDISSEEKDRIKQICARVFEIEQEIHRLNLIGNHLKDDQVFEIPFDELVAYGFDHKLHSE
ncbi:MAG: hypothetical protein AAGJ38_03430 [Planctomycetota bacterium]